MMFQKHLECFAWLLQSRNCNIIFNLISSIYYKCCHLNSQLESWIFFIMSCLEIVDLKNVLTFEECFNTQRMHIMNEVFHGWEYIFIHITCI